MAAVQRDTGQEICPAVAGLWRTHHRPLVRLAVLLTGDSAAAEAAVLEAFVALHRLRRCGLARDDALRALRRLVVAQCRRAAGRQSLAGGAQEPPPSGVAAHSNRTPAAGGRTAVVLALRALPAAQREAVVLTLYLDLSEAEAAAAMRASPAALRRHLAAGRAALQAALPVLPA